MRTGALFAVFLCLASGARSQVSIDMRALDSLGGASRAAPVPARRPATPTVPAARSATREASPPIVTTPVPAPAPASRPPVASAPAPTLPSEQPSAPPASATAATPAHAPEPLPPVRLVFEHGKTDLTPADEATIRD